MTKASAIPARPYPRPQGRDEWQYVKSARDGAYWQDERGLVVRVAAAEHAHDTAPAAAAREGSGTAQTIRARKEGAAIARAWHLVFGR
jgi:hypothetical protein